MISIMDNPIISLIFVNYRSAFELSLALKSLFSFEQGKISFEVIVVNNDSSEQKVLEALQKSFSFQLYHTPSNAGFGVASNMGAKKARGRLLGFLNPDILWKKTMLADIERYFQEKSDAVVLGATLVGAEGERDRLSSGKAPCLIGLIKKNLFPFFGGATHTDALDWVSGGALFVAKRVFQSIGGFDEKFFLYFEDVDFCVRAKKTGSLVVSRPDFFVFHHGGKSFASRMVQKKQFFVSQKQYYKKHRPFWETGVVSFFQSARRIFG